MTDRPSPEAAPEPFKPYLRRQIAELRPYIPGEKLEYVSISAVDREAGSPKPGDMIARNPKNHADQWLVAAAYFADNFEALVASPEPSAEEIEAAWNLAGRYANCTCEPPRSPNEHELTCDLVLCADAIEAALRPFRAAQEAEIARLRAELAFFREDAATAWDTCEQRRVQAEKAERNLHELSLLANEADCRRQELEERLQKAEAERDETRRLLAEADAQIYALWQWSPKFKKSDELPQEVRGSIARHRAALASTEPKP